MSVKVMGMVWDCDMKRDQKFILLAYADHADHDGNNVFPAVSTIMRKTGYSERSVQNITANLVTDKYLIDDGQGPHGTNKWKINLDKLRGAKTAGVQDEEPKEAGGGAKNDAQTAPDSSLNHPLQDKPSKDSAAPAAAPPEPEPEPTPKPPTAQQLMVQALSDVTMMDMKIHGGRLGRTASKLNKADYTPEQVAGLFSEGSIWYKRDWRGQRGDPPTPEQVAENITKFMAPEFQDAPTHTNGRPQTVFERNMEGLRKVMEELEDE